PLPTANGSEVDLLPLLRRDRGRRGGRRRRSREGRPRASGVEQAQAGELTTQNADSRGLEARQPQRGGSIARAADVAVETRLSPATWRGPVVVLPPAFYTGVRFAGSRLLERLPCPRSTWSSSRPWSL